MSTALFKKTDYELSKLIFDIDHGDIGLPDLQRPFVWEQSKVRDLFDSMYRGFPVGYFLFWTNEEAINVKHIGTEEKSAKYPRTLIIDGQQRLTSLYAVIKGKEVLNEDYKPIKIQIAFNPKEEKFEVADASIKRNPEFISDISEIWNCDSFFSFVNDFITNLIDTKGDITIEERRKIENSISKLNNVLKYQFSAMEISSSVSEEEVSEIFVRINSKGKQLNQSDFILTLLSVFWDEGRKELEEFSRKARTVNDKKEASPFNHFIFPSPDQLLRVSVGVAFKRARLKYVYSILKGKDLDSGITSRELQIKQLEKLMKSQNDVLNLNNWHEFMKILIKAGYRNSSMISSEMTLIYCYVLFLIGKIDFKLEQHKLRSLISKWFMMCSLTGRYTGSPETIMEGDLNRLRDVKNSDDFVYVFERIIKDSLTNDFWSITIANNLETSSSISPALNAYFASLNILNANVLFSDLKVSELLDPAIKSKRSPIEKHHLFPKNYLDGIGITNTKDKNQAANYTFLEFGDNNDISDLPPSEYFPIYSTKYSKIELKDIMELHALPNGWESMDYWTFLDERRRLMGNVIKKAFNKL